jgi:hypothetical protein
LGFLVIAGLGVCIPSLASLSFLRIAALVAACAWTYALPVCVCVYDVLYVLGTSAFPILVAFALHEVHPKKKYILSSGLKTFLGLDDHCMA